MYLAYFIENTTAEVVDNTGLFKIINDLRIEEDNVYIDTCDSKEELEKLLKKIDNNSSDPINVTVVVRSVVDLSDSAKGLLDILSKLQGKGVILCSVTEPYMSGEDYYTKLSGFLKIHRYYAERLRKEGFQKAKVEGRVGRPKMTEEIEKAVRLYNTRAFTTAEIEKLSGVSSSTLYRALKEQEN